MTNELGDLLTRATANLSLDPEASAAVIGKVRRARRYRVAAAGVVTAGVLAAAIAVPLTSNSGDVQRIAPIDSVAPTPTPLHSPSSLPLDQHITGARTATPSPIASVQVSPSPIPIEIAPSASVAPSGPASNVAPVPPASVSPSPIVGACSFAELRVTAGKEGFGLGHSGFPIVFQNVGGVTCTIEGYPGVAGLDDSGRQVTQAQRTPSGYLGGLQPGQAMSTVALSPGEQASALVEGTDNPQGDATSCPKLSGLLVTPPNTRQSIRLSFAPGDCSGLEIHPVVAGSTGRDY